MIRRKVQSEIKGYDTDFRTSNARRVFVSQWSAVSANDSANLWWTSIRAANLNWAAAGWYPEGRCLMGGQLYFKSGHNQTTVRSYKWCEVQNMHD